MGLARIGVGRESPVYNRAVPRLSRGVRFWRRAGRAPRFAFHPNLERSEVGFWNTVCIRESPETVALGLAGCRGSVYGMTAPSSSGVSVIGACEEDFALSVYFGDEGRQLWFSPDLIEPV
jgi:hypothetical protein